MWSKHKGKAKYLIIVLMTFFLVSNVLGVHYGYDTKESSWMFMVLMSILFMVNWALEIGVSSSYKALCRLERNLNIESIELSKHLIQQIEELLAHNKALLIENHLLEKNNVHPIRERKND